MKKYYFIIKSSLKEQMNYLGNIFGGFIVYGIVVFVFLQLWTYIYEGKSNLNGYTLNQLIWYVIMTELIFFTFRSRVVHHEISEDIKSGKIAYILNKPYTYIMYVLSKHTGTIIPNFISFSLFGVLLGTIYVGPLETFQLSSVPFTLLTVIIGGTIYALIYILIGLTAFWFEENAPFKWIFSKVIVVLGITFPIEFMPDWLIGFAKVSPVYPITYGPAKMLVDFSFSKFIDVFCVQVIYLLVISLLISFVYSKGVKRINVNGG